MAKLATFLRSRQKGWELDRYEFSLWWHKYSMFLNSFLPNLQGEKYSFAEVTLTRLVPFWGDLPPMINVIITWASSITTIGRHPGGKSLQARRASLTKGRLPQLVSDYKSYLWRGYELHIGNDHSGSIGFQSSLKFLDLMSSKSGDAVLAAVVHELLGNGGQRADDNNRWACESQI